MKQKLLWIIFVLVTASQGATLEAGARFAPELKPEQTEAQAAQLPGHVVHRATAHLPGPNSNGRMHAWVQFVALAAVLPADHVVTGT